jgi:2-polyprenyl-3-methyl-5-hydroxy-6-metoxy-1,4-benzoquinol methylase
MEKKLHADNQTPGEVQTSNQGWWTKETMSYDWNEKIEHEKFSLGWFEEVDRRFIFGARLFAHEDSPFDKIIPFSEMKGKRVLEIGCGMGLHSELMTRAGAEVVAVDISETSVEATKRRFELKNLQIEVYRGDAVELQFPPESFDYVWSWGAIHHSAYTGRIVRQFDRVLRPGGQAHVMVYHLGGMPAYIVIFLRYLLGFWANRRLDEYLWKSSDGYIARYYTKDSLSDLFYTFFEEVNINIYGQDADAIPLPRRLRGLFLSFLSDEKLAQWGNRRGSLIQAVATKANNGA